MEHRGRYAVASTVIGLALGVGGWGASMSGVLSPALGRSMMLISALIIFITVVWMMVWPKRRRAALVLATLGSLVVLYGWIGVASGTDPLQAIYVWAREIPDFEKGIAFGLGMILLAGVVAYLGYRYRLALKNFIPILASFFPREHEAGAPQPISLVDPFRESIERLREAYACCGPTIGFVYEILSSDLLSGYLDTDWKRTIAFLTRRYALPQHIQKKNEMDTKLGETRARTEEEFHALLMLFHGALVDYMNLVAIFKDAGNIFLGEEQFTAYPKYLELTRRHARCLEELQRLRGRSDTRAVTDTIFQELQGLLPRPQEHP